MVKHDNCQFVMSESRQNKEEAAGRRIVLRPDRDLAVAIDLAAARAQLSTPALLLQLVAKSGPVAVELAEMRKRELALT